MLMNGSECWINFSKNVVNCACKLQNVPDDGNEHFPYGLNNNNLCLYIG